MRRVQACGAAAAWIYLMLSLSACSYFQFMAPPELPGPPPEATLPASAPRAPQSLAPPSPGEAYAEIVRWFSAAGYRDYQVQALAEHAQAESGFRPCAAGPGGYRYLYQWSSTRLEHLHQFAHTDGCPQLHAQLAFADKELKTDPKFACFWQATSEDAAYAALRRGFGRGSC
jgi:Phage tail lysozyme